jgi:hypothetical protein
MASVNDCNDWHVRVVSRRLLKASDTSIKQHVVTVSNLDLIARIIQISMFCVYAKPPAGDFDAVVATFEAGLPFFLNLDYGAELVVGKAAGVALASLDYGAMGASLQKI